VFVVVALSLLMLGIFASDLRRLWQPVGVFGYLTNGDGTVLSVNDNSPAGKVGMQTGDRVDVAATPPQFRTLVVQGTFVSVPGQHVTFGLVHRGQLRSVTLTAVASQSDGLDKTFWLMNFAAAVLFVSIGAALVLLRPGLTTWGFFLYCLAFSPGSWISAWVTPYPLNLITSISSYLIQVAGLVGLLVFALSFLSESVGGWRSAALRLTPALFVALALLWLFTFYQMYWVGGSPGDVLFRSILWITAILSFLALYAFVDTYVRARGTDRQRMQWIIVGFAVSLTGYLLFEILAFYAPKIPSWVLDSLLLTGVLVPLTIGYAVIKHRVIDVNFVVNRALVYGTLTTLLVAAFSIIDWFFVDYLRLARLGTIAEVVAVVAFGLWFKGLHMRVDSFIDATFFRQRHAAQRQLARNAAALPFATTPQIVATALVKEPVRALGLASAALFRRNKDGVYMREESAGWSAADIQRLADSDGHFLMLLQAENGPVSLYDHPWRTHGVPSGPAHPVLALPITVRRELVAVVLYGAHTHGEPLDPDEIKAIAGLASAAAAAYDHLEADALRREVESLRSQLAEAQIQPA